MMVDGETNRPQPTHAATVERERRDTPLHLSRLFRAHESSPKRTGMSHPK